MADKYIWHNTGAKELYNWAICFGHTQANENVTLEDTSSEEYKCLCNVLGVSSLSTPVYLIRRDRWYIKGPVTFYFPSTIDKLHIKRRQGDDLRIENTATYTFTYSLDEYEACITEFNYTSRLKKEGYGWQENGAGDIQYPLSTTWNSHSTQSVSRGETSPYNAMAINQNDSDQNILFPFRGIKQCLVPGYLTSDDSDEGAAQGSINGAIFNTKALDPLSSFIGTHRSINPDRYTPGYSFGYDMQYSADNSGYYVPTKKDDTKMWNLCLYPLVLIDDTAGKKLDKKINITTENNQTYIQVFAGNTPITKKIPYNKDIDYLVAYKQDRVSCSATLNVADSGIPEADPAIPGQNVKCLWYDKSEQGSCGSGSRVWTHVNIFMYLDVVLEFDPANMFAYNWDAGESGTIYNSSNSLGSNWLDIKNSSTPQKYKKYKDLFEVISRNMSENSNAPTYSPKWKRFETADGTNSAFTKMGSTDRTSLTEYSLGSKSNMTDFTEYVKWDKITCCDDNSCGDLTAYARTRAVVAGTWLSVKGKLRWNSDVINPYINYIKYWFGEANSKYWIGDDSNSSYKPPVATNQPNITGSISITKTDAKFVTLSGGNILYYIDNFYCPTIVNKTETLEWYVPVSYQADIGGDFKLNWTNITITPKTGSGGSVSDASQEVVVVLWVHELPDGNLAA